MAPLELQVTVHSAKDLKNVNWRYGDLRPYAVLWVDPKAKRSTRVDDGDTCPVWDETLTITLTDRRIEDSILAVDIVHANADEDVKPLIGSARVPLKEIIDTVGFGEKFTKSLKLKRPSGRPHGKLEATIIIVREPHYYGAPAPAPGTYVLPYGQGTRDYQYGYAPPPQPVPYVAGPPQGYSAGPPQGYPYNPPLYGQSAYGQPSYEQPAYSDPAYGASPAKKGSKYGVGTGLAVGAVAGVLGGLALAEGVDYVEDKISDDVAEKVEDDLAYDDGDYGGDDY